MPRLTIGLGAILIALGVISYIVTGFASWTALIPAILGLVIAICGFIAAKSRRTGVILGLVVALLGILGTAMNVIQLGDVFTGAAERPVAVVVSTITFASLVVYVIVGIRSILVARRNTGARP